MSRERETPRTATDYARIADYMSTGGLASIVLDRDYAAPPTVLDRWLAEREAISDPLEDERDAELEALDEEWDAAPRMTCGACGRFTARLMRTGPICSGGCDDARWNRNHNQEQAA